MRKNQKSWWWIFFLYLPFVSYAQKSFKQEEKQTSVYVSSIQSDYHYIVGELASLKGQSSEAVYFFKKDFDFNVQRGQGDYIRLRLGQEYIKQGLGHQAEKEFLWMTTHTQNKDLLLSVRFLLADIYASMNFFDRAIEQYNYILEIDAENQEALLNQSLMLVQRGGIVSSKNIQILDNDPRFHHYIGDIYWMQGNKIEAIKSFKKAISLDPSYRAPALRLFQIYSEKDLYKQWTHFMEKHTSDDVYIRSLMAQAYLRQGENEKVLETLEDLLWDHPLVWNLRAEIALAVF